jgi:hypothetical protein
MDSSRQMIYDTILLHLRGTAKKQGRYDRCGQVFTLLTEGCLNIIWDSEFYVIPIPAAGLIIRMPKCKMS